MHANFSDRGVIKNVWKATSTQEVDNFKALLLLVKFHLYVYYVPRAFLSAL